MINTNGYMGSWQKSVRSSRGTAAVCNLPLLRLGRVRGSCLLGSLTLISDTLSGRLLRWFFISKRGSSCHLIAVVIRWRFYFLIRTRQREKKRVGDFTDNFHISLNSQGKGSMKRTSCANHKMLTKESTKLLEAKDQ
jgi:hypothetical protein